MLVGELPALPLSAMECTGSEFDDGYVGRCRGEVDRTLHRHTAQTPLETIGAARLEAHGVLSLKTKHALRRRIATEVIRPSLARLFG